MNNHVMDFENTRHYHISPLNNSHKIPPEIIEYIEEKWIAKDIQQADIVSFPLLKESVLIKRCLKDELIKDVQNLNDIYETCERAKKYIPILHGFQVEDYKYHLIVIELPLQCFKLEKFIATDQNLKIGLVRDIISQIIRALVLLHSSMIAHRDLCMHNILVSYNMKKNKCQIHLVDLCTMSIGEATKMPTNFTGNSNFFNEYMLSELPFPRDRDVYSVGAICFLLMFGEKYTYEFNNGNDKIYNTVNYQDIINTPKRKWDTRVIWANLRSYLHRNGISYYEIGLIRILLNSFLRNTEPSIQDIMRSNKEWLSYYKCSIEDYESYLFKSH